MATISKSGISNGSTIESEHITRIIDALDGTSSAAIIASGSFTGTFIGQTRVTKKHITVTNSSAVTGHPSGSDIYPGTIASIDLSQNSSNQVYFTLGDRDSYTDGDRYEFIVVRSANSSEYFKLDTSAGDRFYGNLIGADGNTQYINGLTSIQSGGGVAKAGDHIVITAIRGASSGAWSVTGNVSGSAGYTVS